MLAFSNDGQRKATEALEGDRVEDEKRREATRWIRFRRWKPFLGGPVPVYPSAVKIIARDPLVVDAIVEPSPR